VSSGSLLEVLVTKREGARKPVDIHATIEPVTGRSCDSVKGRIRDISLSGVYVEMPTEDLAKYVRLRLNIGSGGDNGGHTCTWECYVVRTTQDGVGCMFDDLDPGNIDGLLEILRDTSPVRPMDSG
jgi:hypothetical protein